MTSSWEQHLRGALDALSQVEGEEPPDPAELQMLVVTVQREQRRRTLQDLAGFWAVALVLVCGLLYGLAERPLYFLALQGAVALLLLTGGLAWVGRQKQVTQ